MAKVFIVDDSPTAQKKMQLLLESHGHEVAVASDALSALSKLESVQPELILLDIMLPGVGGIETCMVISRNPHYANTPIIMVTGLRTQATIAEFAGAQAYIVKPYDDDTFMDAINAVLVDYAYMTYE